MYIVSFTYRCPACSESFHVEFLLDRHLQTHHAQNESTVNNSNFSLEKEITLQNYHPSLIESYREKFLLSHDQKLGVEASFLQKFNPSVFSHLHPYSKNLRINALHESLNNRTQSADDHSMRVKNLYNLTNEAIVKSQSEDAKSTEIKIQNFPVNTGANDKNNNKNSGNLRENNETQYENPPVLNTTTTDKSQVIHLNSKSGVSLKCAYCEAREDFKTRYI